MGSEYWDRGPAWSRRISRRAALRGGVISAAGLSAAFIAACGGKSNNNNSNAAPATNTNANRAAAAGTPAASAAAAAATAKGTAAAAAIKRGGSLKYRGAEVFTSLDPTYSSSYMDLFMSFEPLLGVNEKGEPGITDASLATAYEQVDPTTLVVHTRNGVKFHDGTDFNAQAVKFSLDRATAPTPPGQIWKSTLLNYDHVDTPDNGTAKITLKKPDGSMLLLLADVAGMMVSPTLYGGKALPDVAWTTGGTGPYHLIDHRQDAFRKWERFQQYWRKAADGGSAALLDTVESDEIPDPTVQVASLQSGQIDLLVSNSPDPAPALLDKDPNIVASHRDGYGLQVLLLNHALPPMDNANLRKGMAWAIDRIALSKSLYNTVFNGDIHSFISPASWAWKNVAAFPGYDLAKAKAYIDASGIPEAERKINFSFSSASPSDPQTFALFQSIFQAIGVQIVYVEAAQAKGKAFKNMGDTPSIHMEHYTQLNKIDPNLLVGPYCSTGGVYNMSGATTANFDDLVAQGTSTLDLNARKAVYGQIQDQQIDGMWFMIPLAIRPTRQYARKNVAGIAYRPGSGWPLYSGLGQA
jgi:peptide/nickel transport system substrate-binding protein